MCYNNEIYLQEAYAMFENKQQPVESLLEHAGLEELKQNEKDLINNNEDLRNLLQRYLFLKEKIGSFRLREIGDWLLRNRGQTNINVHDALEQLRSAAEAIVSRDFHLPFKDVVRMHIEEYAKATNQNAIHIIKNNEAVIKSAMIATTNLIDKVAEISTEYPNLAVANKDALPGAILSLTTSTDKLAAEAKQLANIHYPTSTSEKWLRRCVGAMGSLVAIAMCTVGIILSIVLLFLSGFSGPPPSASEVSKKCVDFIKKPYRYATNTSAIGETCDTLDEARKLITQISKAVKLPKSELENKSDDSQSLLSRPPKFGR